MSKRVIKCPECGKDAESPGTEAVMWIKPGRGNVTRHFSGTCPSHGWFIVTFPGHHATMWKQRLKRMFPTAVRKSLLTKLSDSDRRLFNEMFHGKREVDWELADRWRKMAK